MSGRVRTAGSDAVRTRPVVLLREAHGAGVEHQRQEELSVPEEVAADTVELLQIAVVYGSRRTTVRRPSIRLEAGTDRGQDVGISRGIVIYSGDLSQAACGTVMRYRGAPDQGTGPAKGATR